jgi:hypothetical protein
VTAGLRQGHAPQRALGAAVIVLGVALVGTALERAAGSGAPRAAARRGRLTRRVIHVTFALDSDRAPGS